MFRKEYRNTNKLNNRADFNAKFTLFIQSN